MSSWDVTIPGSVVIAILVVLCCIFLLLFVKTCISIFDCMSRTFVFVLDTFKPVYILVNSLIPQYTAPYNPSDYVKVHQFPRNHV
uniref:Envelope protein n=1 Tax=Bird deltacoronavirus AnasCN24 TaxID=3237947 RepID=A0AB39AGD9_9NIDO